MEKKRITNQAIAQYIGSHRDVLEDEVGIERKDSFFKGKNIDYVFQGAAGSGKSTISRQFLDDETKKNYITLATDNYRGVEVPGTHRHEEGNETKNIFIRTQDMAYLVKELVHEELQSIIDNGSRPHIIIDCVNMDEFMHSLLEGSKEVNSFVAAYTGDSGIGIAERAEKRAITSEAPADKGRFMNTDSLFYSHASVSQNLLSAVPQTVITKIHSTDVDYGDKAPRIAEIDPVESNLRIYDLRLSSSFFNKKDIYTKAQSPIELAQGKYGDSLSIPKKAEVMLDLVKNKHGGKSYSVDLFENTESSKKYASITCSKKGNLELKIHNKELFEKLAYDPASIQGGILRSISRQIAYGSRKNEMSQIAERKEERLEADILSFEEAYNHIKETKGSQIIQASNGIDSALIKKAISVMSESFTSKRAGKIKSQARGCPLTGKKSDRIL